MCTTLVLSNDPNRENGMRLLPLLACLAAQSGCVPAERAEIPRGETGSAAREPDVRYEPTEPEVVDAMLRLAKVTSTDVVYDLGSGDGRIPIRAASQFGARAVGVEIQPHLVTIARANALQAGVADRAKFMAADLFEADLREATVVTLFLYPDVNLRLIPKLKAELRPGTRVISHWHSMGDWQPDQRILVSPEGQRARWLYLWTIRGKSERGQ